jgi:LPS export ABC transporter protein LptC
LPALSSCREEKKLDTTNIDTAHMPTMTTHNVMTIISDSGIPQYRLTGPVWYVYDDIDTPLWILPGGPYLEKFDPQFNIVFTVACDSAVNNQLTSEWYLKGNVQYKQDPGVLILTQELRWNQRLGTVQSDSFIHIEQPGKIIEGYGFEGKTSARGDLTSYRLHHPTGVLPYDRNRFAGGVAMPGAMPGAPMPTNAAPPAPLPANIPTTVN